MTLNLLNAFKSKYLNNLSNIPNLEQASYSNKDAINSKYRPTRTKLVVSTGTPIYTVKDILCALNPIAKLIRMIFIDNVITHEEFDSAYKTTGMMEGKLPKDIATVKNNALKALVKDRISVTQFEKILQILGFKILNINYTLQNIKTGEIKEYKLSDFSFFVQKKQQDENLSSEISIPENKSNEELEHV